MAAFELRPLKTGEILDGAITLMRRQFVVFFGYSVVVQVAALEPLKSGTDALRRSWMLTKGFKAKAFVLWIVAIVLIVALALAGGLVGGLAATVNPALEPVSTVLLAILLLLYYPLLACVFTLFYYDLRVRKEAFDLEMLAEQLGGAPAP